jgi:hypothetical protein
VCSRRGILEVDALERIVLFMLYFLLVYAGWFVFVFGESFESEKADGVRAVIDFHFDGVDEKTTVFFISFNFYL